MLLIGVAVAAGRSYRDLTAYRARVAALSEQIEATERRSVLLEAQIERLKSDPVTWQWLARNELGLVAPGEILVVLPERRSSPADPSR